MTGQFSRRLKKQGINLKVTEEAVDILTKKGFDPAFWGKAAQAGGTVHIAESGGRSAVERGL